MRAVTCAAFAAITLALGGCVSSPRGLESVHQPVVTRSAYVVDLIMDGSGGIDVGEQRRLTQWLDALHLGYGDRIALDYGDGYGTAASRQTVEAIAARYGMLVADTAPVTSGGVPAGTARVVVTRSTAAVPGCPDWRKKLEADFTGGTHSNFGCGTNSTIAAMIADPEDLVAGRPAGGSDAESGTKPIKAYRDKTSTAGATSGAGVGGKE